MITDSIVARLTLISLITVLIGLVSPQTTHAYPQVTSSTGPTNPAPSLPEL